MSSMSPSLLLRVQANQAGAWERLVELYAPLVYHWCRRAQLGPEDTADLFQEVFRAVAGHIAEFRRDGPVTWGAPALLMDVSSIMEPPRPPPTGGGVMPAARYRAACRRRAWRLQIATHLLHWIDLP